MAVDPASISVCKCYVVIPSGQVRHVIEVDDTEVRYESRGKRHKSFPSDRPPPVNKEKFAAVVDREVPCHHDLDIHG